MSDSPKAALVDNSFAPQIFADSIAGFYINSGNVTVTLASWRVDHSIEPGMKQRAIVGRVILQASTAQTLAVQLYNFLKQHGLDPAGKSEGQSVQ